MPRIPRRGSSNDDEGHKPEPDDWMADDTPAVDEDLPAVQASAEPEYESVVHAPEAAAPAPSSIQVVKEPSATDDEYQWHMGLSTPSGQPDAVEFIDVLPDTLGAVAAK